MSDLENTPPPAIPCPVPSCPPPSSTPPCKLLQAARKRHATLSEILAHGPASLSDANIVHDLRVGSRRLGEVARLLKTFLDKPTAKAVAASLRALRHAMGDLRDADVTCEHLRHWRMPAALKKIADEIAATLESQRPALVAAAQTQMTSASLVGSMVILARVLDDKSTGELAPHSERQLQETLRALVKAREKQLRRAFGFSAKKQTAESLHAARIEVKKLRYLLELAAEAGAVRGAKKKVVFLKQLQQLLGDHHDVHVILAQLAAQIKIHRPTPLKNLSPAWRKWQRTMARRQAHRAAIYFGKTYTWING